MNNNCIRYCDCIVMATTAKQQPQTNSSVGVTTASSHSASPSSLTEIDSSELTDHSSNSHFHSLVIENDDDIESIAKQISDHAEIIYQTWKARGLAPTEILNCQSINSAAFDKTLTPSQSRRRRSSSDNEQSRSESNVSIVKTDSNAMSNNNLKKLVSNFVHEDKARQQQQQQTIVARKTNILTSGTIKDALRKFETADSSAPLRKPNFLKYSSTDSQPKPDALNSSSVAKSNHKESPKNSTSTSPSANAPDETNNFGGLKNVPDVLIDSLGQDNRTTPKATSPSKGEKPAITRPKPETPAKPASLLNHSPTWKNRVKGSEGAGKTTKPSETNGKSSAADAAPKSRTDSSKTNGQDGKTIAGAVSGEEGAKAKSTKNKVLLDEVLMEEERLINALKTGTVLSNDKPLPEVISSALATGASAPKVNNSWKPSDESAIPHSAKVNGGDISSSANSLGDGGDSVQLKLTKARPKNDAAVPHPDLSLHSSKSASSIPSRNAGAGSAVRPFLTRGSVAERVLMFEKCPEVKALRTTPKDSSKLTAKPQPKANQTQSCTTLQRSVRGSKNIYIPRFHFPYGKPLPTIAVETTLQRLQAAFDAFPNNAVPKDNFLIILKICAMPFYWRMPLFNCTQLTPGGLVDGKRFCDFWKQMSVFCHDTVSRFVFILSRGQRSRPYILPEDLVGLVQDVVDTHPGLAFLKEASEFHSRYVHTVIARIFYAVNRSWSGKVTMAELRRSDLLQVLQLLEEEEDINQIMAYFSYEHFYVIYCKFWELDRDHDLFIDQTDLARHNDHALSTRIIERIFSGCVTKTNKVNSQKMSYTEFVWFLLSEEDKSHPTAVEYWFRCMDLDGDGILSMYELEYFYEEQQHRMESIGIETLPFEDCLCQMFDMIKPSVPGCITLSDLKRCRMTPIFFDTFFNLEKYLEHEQRDPFASQRDQEDMTDWDRYAAQEYELLVAEEGGDTNGSYDDEEDYEANIDILESQLDDQMVCGVNDI